MKELYINERHEVNKKLRWYDNQLDYYMNGDDRINSNKCNTKIFIEDANYGHSKHISYKKLISSLHFEVYYKLLNKSDKLAVYNLLDIIFYGSQYLYLYRNNNGEELFVDIDNLSRIISRANVNEVHDKYEQLKDYYNCDLLCSEFICFIDKCEPVKDRIFISNKKMREWLDYLLFTYFDCKYTDDACYCSNKHLVRNKQKLIFCTFCKYKFNQNMSKYIPFDMIIKVIAQVKKLIIKTNNTNNTNSINNIDDSSSTISYNNNIFYTEYHRFFRFVVDHNIIKDNICMTRKELCEWLEYILYVYNSHNVLNDSLCYCCCFNNDDIKKENICMFCIIKYKIIG